MYPSIWKRLKSKLVHKENVLFWLKSILNSYAQIFFSLNTVLAVIILLVTFITPYMGICGLMAIVLTNLIAYSSGFSRQAVGDGAYGFNALLLGLALGYEYQFNIAFVVVAVGAIFLLLFNTVWLQAMLSGSKLPFLSLPFLFTYWMVYLASGAFSFLQSQEQYIYTENYIANASQSPIYLFAHSLDTLALPLLVKAYIKTLSSIFFQNSVLAGMIIAGGLLYFSRIAFTLSLIGFAGAFYCFQIIGLDTVLLTDYLIGSNYILLAISIGGFFLVPSKWSYLAVLLLIPVLSIFLISFGKVLMIFQLKAFTLSFSVLTILFLSFLNHRWWHHFVQLVSIQYYSAEKTIYKHLNATKRHTHAHLAKITLPFWGEWKVSQGYDGTITHLGDWSKALDFVLVDDKENTYQLPGTVCKEFYCYDKPVTAPYDGFVYMITNTVEDNPIGGVDTVHNWGNTIILNHQNGLFTQLSHLKKDSMKVRIGDYVTRGTMLATCGNSGRSPEPHIHFQLQLSPKIGEKTYAYPIAYFLQREENRLQLKTFEIPQENALIRNVETHELLTKSYDLQPGMTIRMRNQTHIDEVHEWTVYTNAYNQTYIYCPKTLSTVWFANDGIMFYCYDFEGDKRSLLFHFYLANYRILLGIYPDVWIKDSYPVLHFSNPVLRVLQDFTAPFYLFLKASYQSQCAAPDSDFGIKSIQYTSQARALIFNYTVRKLSFEMHFQEKRLHQFIVHQNQHKKIYVCEIF